MISFTFPGQGSQKPAMGAAWVDHPSWELVDEATTAAGRDVAHLLLDADADELKATRNAQLSTFVASLIVLDAVERLGVEPSIVAGHSLGEYTALVASGALAFDDGVRLVAERGEAMQAAATDRVGTMAAVLGLDDDLVEIACARVDDDVWVANYNAPGQVVIAGSPDGVDGASAAAKDLGAKRILSMAVSGAFHTPFMAPAHSSPPVWGRASTLAYTGRSGARRSASASAERRRSRAGAMNGVWNAPLTVIPSTFLAPRSLAAAEAPSTPSGEPAMTTWPGAL